MNNKNTMYLKVDTTDAASKLSELLKDGDWMVLYYAEWCGHCKSMKPEWEKVVEKLKDSGKINIADIKSDVIGALSHKPNIEGFPTIKMYNKGNEVAKFEDARSAEKLEKFAISNANSNNKKTAVKNAINTALQKLAEKDIVNPTDSIHLEELQTAPSLLPSIVGDNSNEVKKISISQLKNEIMSSHRKSNNNIIEIKNENNQVNQTRASKKQTTNMGNLDMLLLPPVRGNKPKPTSHKPKPSSHKPSIHKPTFKKIKTQKNGIIKRNTKPNVPLACSDIRKAKLCKTNPKCSFDYIEFKCKDKSKKDKLEIQVPTLNIINNNIGSKRSKKTQRQITSQKNTNKNGTKAILQELQKSFNIISNEARKDSNLLAKASDRI